ncbi:MAG: hypothetical protein EOM52_00010 [Clostridia bacterium]|nr:hypothetical protein [Clostridia bacterium]
MAGISSGNGVFCVSGKEKLKFVKRSSFAHFGAKKTFPGPEDHERQRKSRNEQFMPRTAQN